MEQRLIDANKILYHQVWESGSMEPTNEAVALMSEVQAMPTIDPETLPIVRQLRADLARVTAERDAAEKDRTELADYELAVCEQFCFGDRERNIAPCAWLIDGMCELRKWRGPRKEE